MQNIIQFNKETDAINDRFIRAKDLTKIFVGISRAVISKWSKVGILKAYKIGGCTFYKESDLVKLIESSRM